MSRVILATDDRRIFDVAGSEGIDVVLTSPEHRSGTDRVAEVAKDLADASVIVNVQGDEPLISPDTIDAAVRALLADPGADMSTTAEPIDSFEELVDGNVVKVVTGDSGYAICFSRSPMPYPREASLRYEGDSSRAVIQEPELLSVFKKHTGLYVYRRDYLLRLSGLPQTKLERIEMLEQLRALEDGARIRVVDAAERSIGVDTQDDYEKVCRIVETLSGSNRSAVGDSIGRAKADERISLNG